MSDTNTITGETCAFCHKKTLTLTESAMEIPYFGKTFVFSMDCSSCKYHKADVEAEQPKEPVKYTLEVTTKEDLNARVIKSSTGAIKIPHVGSIEPGPESEGYITNVEGIIQRIKKQVEVIRDTEEDEDAKKKAKNLLKKLQKILWGEEQVKIILEDPQGNSAIISDKVIKGK